MILSSTFLLKFLFALVFKAGSSGNPAGKKPGTLSKYTKARKLLWPYLPALINKAVRLALNGDTVLLATLLKLLIPPLKSEALPVQLPGINPDATPSVQAKQLIKTLTDGKLSPDDVHSVMDILSRYVKVIEATEFENRIIILEKEIKKLGKKQQN